MTPLFETGPKIDRHIESIISQMLKTLRNNNPDKDSECYLNTVKFINEIYTGDFLKRHYFDFSKDSQFNVEGNMEKIRSAANDWGKVKELILNAMEHLEQSKDKSKMPWNKKYVESITFARFFDHGKVNESGLMDSPFLKFINPPKDSYAYTSGLTIDKLKKQTSSVFRENAEKFCKKHFKEKSKELAFWYNMIEWTEWLKRFRKNYGNIYSEFISACVNPFDDYTKFLTDFLKKKEGENVMVMPYHFQLVKIGEKHLSGIFLLWLRTGIENKKFEILRHMPKSIDNYYTEESFNNVKTEKVKEVVDIDDIVIF